MTPPHPSHAAVANASGDRVVYAFAKNAREDVRVTHSHFKGRALIDIRAFYRSESGELKPSPKGVSIARELLPELEAAVRALRAAETEQAS